MQLFQGYFFSGTPLENCSCSWQCDWKSAIKKNILSHLEPEMLRKEFNVRNLHKQNIRIKFLKTIKIRFDFEVASSN